jgi:hypothetical protein
VSEAQGSHRGTQSIILPKRILQPIPRPAMTRTPKSGKIELPLREDSEVQRLVQEFESLSLPYENWTHRAHLAVAMYYVRSLSFEDALTQLRLCINAYNVACGNPNGYNETITIMFLRKIVSESKNELSKLDLHEGVARLEALCKVEWLYQYYTPELIWSPEAKKCWVNPDVRELDF